MSAMHPMRPAQMATEPDGTIHRDFFRWLGRLMATVNYGIVPPKGIVRVELTGAEVTANFDGTGLGNQSGPYDGWAVCNGNNGTPVIADLSIMRLEVSL